MTASGWPSRFPNPRNINPHDLLQSLHEKEFMWQVNEVAAEDIICNEYGMKSVTTDCCERKRTERYFQFMGLGHANI